MKRYSILLFAIIVVSLYLYSCSSSIGSRYSSGNKKVEKDSVRLSNHDISKEEFDISAYKTKIEIPSTDAQSADDKNVVWLQYENTSHENKVKTISETKEGYRVIVLTTDNLEEANQVKADVYFGQNGDEVYIDFEPPFYKVKVGDFNDKNSADALRFKLNQLGYKESKVVKETINVYK